LIWHRRILRGDLAIGLSHADLWAAELAKFILIDLNPASEALDVRQLYWPGK
jgi:hypothetical protein